MHSLLFADCCSCDDILLLSSVRGLCADYYSTLCSVLSVKRGTEGARRRVRIYRRNAVGCAELYNTHGTDVEVSTRLTMGEYCIIVCMWIERGSCLFECVWYVVYNRVEYLFSGWSLNVPRKIFFFFFRSIVLRYFMYVW